MATKFEPDKIYEVVYTAQNPPVVGLGPAAIRDVDLDAEVPVGRRAGRFPPARSRARSAFGISQSGRFLRTYLYYGFNRDEGNRKVFDGVIAHVAGAGRGSFNHRFAQPSRDGHPYINFFYPTDIFPFTDVAAEGSGDGRDRRPADARRRRRSCCRRSSTRTRSTSTWGRAASLIHTTVDGTADAPLMDNVRIYLLTAGQHGPGAFPPAQTIGQQRNNPLDYRWAMKALLRRDGSLDRERHGAAAEPLSARRRRHARARPIA